MDQLNTTAAEELERLQNKVAGFEKLLQAFQQSQLQQTQALAAFLSQNREDGIKNIPDQKNTRLQYQIPRKPPPNSIQPPIAMDTVGKHESASFLHFGNGFDVRKWAEAYGFDEITKLDERFLNTRIPDPKTASDELRQEGFNFSWVPKGGDESEEDGEEDGLRLPEFLSLVGEGPQPVDVIIRDFTDMACEKVLYYKASDYGDLWKALSRPRKLGMKTLNTTIHPGWEKVGLLLILYILIAIMLKSLRITAIKAINEDGQDNHAYGREIVINQLTPNVAMAVLITTAYSGLQLDYIGPVESLILAMSLALAPEPRSLQNYEGYMNYDTFMFTAVFFELVDDDGHERPITVTAPSYKGERFGSQWEGRFAPRNSTRTNRLKNIRQTTLSLVFDSMGTENGTYWTITSMGQYSDERAFEKPRNVKEVEKYTAPEEVFLDKLARVIDWAVDDGMLEVLDQLELELEIPVDTLFSQEENEKLLFDDHQFSRSKRYHWALQWLRKMSDCMNELVTAIEEFEKTSLPNLRRNAQAHRVRSKGKMGKSDLSSEKVFERKVERARQLKTKIEAKYTEIKDFRDALVSASGVLESRAAVSQAESMHILTVFMIIFLPITVVIALFSMPIMPEDYQTLSAFGITMGVVFVVTLVLGLNLGSILLLLAENGQRFGRYLQSSMISVGDSWAEKGKALKDTDEAENLVRRGKKVPAELWYTWYCIMWLMFLLPANELYKLGGLRGLMSTGYVKITSSNQTSQSEPIWAIAIIPFRLILLPLHAIAILVDYFLLMIFSKGLLGWEFLERSPGPGKGPRSKRPLKDKPTLGGNSGSHWRERLWAPIAILKEIPVRGLSEAPRHEGSRQGGTRAPLGFPGGEGYSQSAMDLLLREIVKSDKEMGPNTESFNSSNTALGASGLVPLDMPSPDTNPYHISMGPEIPHPAQPGQQTTYPQQGIYYLPQVLPNSVTRHGISGRPGVSRAESLPIQSSPGWELSPLGIINRSVNRPRGSEFDPERGEKRDDAIPEN